MLGGYRNVEGVDLRERGKDPVITPVDQLGVPTYDELVLVANRTALEEDPEKFRLFIAALRARHRSRGGAAAGRDRRRSSPPTTRLEPKLTEAEVEATLPLLARPDPRPALRLHGPGRVGNLRRLDARQRPDRVAAEPSELLSNAYLSGEIPE